jgi:hypothetical protein
VDDDVETRRLTPRVQLQRVNNESGQPAKRASRNRSERCQLQLFVRQIGG